MSCLFCKIASGEIPCHKIFENDAVLVFLDINPVNPGHVLLVPKKHCENLLDAPPQILSELATIAPTIAKAVMQAFDYPGFNLSVNNGQSAGQAVMHLHWHIVPRKENDGHKLFCGRAYLEGEAEEAAKKIKSFL